MHKDEENITFYCIRLMLSISLLFPLSRNTRVSDLRNSERSAMYLIVKCMRIEDDVQRMHLSDSDARSPLPTSPISIVSSNLPTRSPPVPPRASISSSNSASILYCSSGVFCFAFGTAAVAILLAFFRVSAVSAVEKR